VGLSLSEREQDRQRMERLGAFSPEQLATGLIWLSGYDPRTSTRCSTPPSRALATTWTAATNPSRYVAGVARRSGSSCASAWTGGTTGNPRDTSPAGTALGPIELFDPGLPQSTKPLAPKPMRITAPSIGGNGALIMPNR
jgi:hypothetical protein